MSSPSPTAPSTPPFRRLRVFAFDPSLQTDLETAAINQAVLKIPWERDPAKDGEGASLEPGPIGEYLEVVDVDPASHCCYRPVNLNDTDLLAQDGLPPSEGNPQFHQQMVYAVAMATIRNFEQALGRLILWAPRRYQAGMSWDDLFVQRLRIYPHALREANAYYSPVKKALLFGYFPASVRDPREHLPRGTVFTCLSHDIVAHETTHALLDGLHRRFIEPTNPDMLAFHEGFADIVAIFQHFTLPEVLRHEIAKTRGDLSAQNLLAKLAAQFGRATGKGDALRDALGAKDPRTQQWQLRQPDPTELERTTEPHARGAILVAAVFDAFLTIYKARIADLVRIATNGTGVLPQGELHPDLVNRLAGEAAKSAQHILTMCIRALDYCPPVDLTFGEYLRALITADMDLVRDDDLGYRTAIIRAFQRRGIFPRDVRSLSVESLLWQALTPQQERVLNKLLPDVATLREFVNAWRYPNVRAPGQAQKSPMTFVDAQQPWSPRKTSFIKTQTQARMLHEHIRSVRVRANDAAELGLDLKGDRKFEIHGVRPTRRVGPDGDTLTDLIVIITQRKPWPNEKKPEFTFRGSCTLLIDPATGTVRHGIFKSLLNDERAERQRQYHQQAAAHAAFSLGLGPEQDEDAEPFALLHRWPDAED